MSITISAFIICFLACVDIEATDPPASQNTRASEAANELQSFGHPFYILLSSPALVDEIAMTEHQRRLQEGLLAETGESVFKLNEAYKRQTEQVAAGKRNELLQEKQQKLQSVFSKYNDRLTEILTSAQQQRLREIRVRILRYTAFLHPGFQSHLGMTDQQVTVMGTLYSQAGAETVGLRKQLDQQQLTKEEYLSKVADIEESFTTDVLNLLTEEQRRRYQKLCGEPLDVDIKSLKFQLDFPHPKPAANTSAETKP